MYETQIHDWFEAHWPDYLKDLAALVAIPSDKGAPLPGKPFGQGPAAALEHALSLAAQYGFSARSMDGYVGLVDLLPGAEDRELEILAHLDVVPAGEDWTMTDPFVMRRLDGKLYGRGTADDKGPALAALYAMRAVRDLGIPVTKNVRLVLGTDEECGSGDISHYYAQVDEAPMTFSPDGDFPVINIEKGFFFGDADWKAPGEDPYIRSISAGVKRNVIPGKARCTLRGIPADVLQLQTQSTAQETGVTFQVTAQGDCFEVVAEGRQGHASIPERYNNALTALLSLLCALPMGDSPVQAQLMKLHPFFPHGDYLGKAAGVACQDKESGVLTLTLNQLHLQDGSLHAEWDSRVPVSAVRERLDTLPAALEEAGFTTQVQHLAPHCVPTDSPFVQTLLRCYEDVTGLEGYSLAIGGGTYVHSLNNGVAFGCTFPGTDNNMHGSDEMAVEEELRKSGEIFAEAIARLCR